MPFTAVQISILDLKPKLLIRLDFTSCDFDHNPNATIPPSAPNKASALPAPIVGALPELLVLAALVVLVDVPVVELPPPVWVGPFVDVSVVELFVTTTVLLVGVYLIVNSGANACGREGLQCSIHLVSWLHKRQSWCCLLIH